MRIGRAIIISAILALGGAGSALSGSAMTAATGHASSAHVLAEPPSAVPDMYYH